MNLGLALSKPGESDLGLAMRLWYANRAIWYQCAQAWDTRINHALSRSPLHPYLKLDASSGLRSIIDAQRALFETRPALKPSALQHTWATSRHRRQCRLCADIGYHSFLFDYPWLTHCPIHESELTTCCPMCREPWPTASSVGARKCIQCGVRRSLDELIEAGAFDAEPVRARISPILEFLERELPTLTENRRYPFFSNALREDRQSRARVLPSVLFHHIDKGIQSAKVPIATAGIPWFECVCRPVNLTSSKQSDNGWDTQPDLAMMAAQRKRTFRLAQRMLSRQADHTLGSCNTHPEFGHYECVSCEAWRQLNIGFNPNLTNRSDFTLLRYSPPFTRLVEVRDPGVICSVYDFASHTKFVIDTESQALIYQTELWLVVRKMVAQIEFYLQADSRANRYFETSSQPHSRFLSHLHHHFACFYFVKDESSCTLYFPKAFVSRELGRSTTLLSLFEDEA